MAEPDAKRQKRTEIKIRFGNVTKDNVGQLKKLNINLFPVRYNEKFYTDVVDSKCKDVVQLVFHQDVVIGAICCRIEDKLPGWKPEHIERTPAKGEETVKKLYVMTLGVLRPYRGYGVGRKMVQRIIDYCLGHSRISDIYLHVQTNNENAMEFYEHFGFQKVHELKNYYKRIDPPDCNVVARSFSTKEKEAFQEKEKSKAEAKKKEAEAKKKKAEAGAA